jgi:hypothetical protein
MSELTDFHAMLSAASTPEGFFGVMAGVDDAARTVTVKATYRKVARVVHSDVNASATALADEAMVLLNALYQQALKRIAEGVYGTAAAPRPEAAPATVVIPGAHHQYIVGEPFLSGDLANLYRGSYDDAGETKACIIKVARDPRDSDLLAREAVALTAVHAMAAGLGGNWPHYLPTVLDAVRIREGSVIRQALVTAAITDEASLEAVRARYPDGVDVRHFVWIWKRLLSAIGLAHAAGVVHGAILPPHVMVCPATHGITLFDWAYSSSTGRATAIPAPYRNWYPREVLDDHRLLVGTDLYLAAQCGIYLLGGDPVAGTLPASVPVRVKNFLQSCRMTAAHRRPQDAWALHEEFDALASSLYGRPRWIDFAMPTPA